MTYDDEKIYVTVKPEDVPRFLTHGFKIEASSGVVMSRSIAADEATRVLRVIAPDMGGKSGD